MKRKILLSFLCCSLAATVTAQKKNTAFAITGPQKGRNSWSEVRLVDLTSGNEVESIYSKARSLELLNARTGKPIVKKESEPQVVRTMYVTPAGSSGNNANVVKERRMIQVRSQTVSHDEPFATNSAACAYDKKHDRLYYTPMGINQLRYIDLKSKTPKIYYFENENFGALNGSRDIPNQVTRMVIGSDGNGYALSNNANHLIRFTTNKKAVVTDLGAIADDPSNGNYSIRSQSAYGGDMVAHKNGDLYLITASRRVFHISIKNKTAKYLGEIRGLPKGFTTNGAMVHEDMSVIVCSSNSTAGYYKFDINNLQAEKISTGETVYNASDLANGNLLTEKKRKKEEPKENILPAQPQPDAVAENRQKPIVDQLTARNAITVYPNPVTTGVVRLVFRDQPEGRYKLQFLDITGKVLNQQEITVNNKLQVQEIKLPSIITAGNYLIQVRDQDNRLVSAEKLVVQR